MKVITIGLGEEVDKNVLEDIANKTGGNFYYASNADGLQNIFEVISAEMNYRLIDIDKDDINDNVMVGNSGFMVRKNGFGFDNFASQSQGAGATYGMSLTSKLVYENAFPNSLGDMTIKLPNSGDVVKTSGYNFSINGKDLYEYVLKFAKERGCYNVTLNVWSCNESAMKFYAKCGLVPQKVGMEKILE